MSFEEILSEFISGTPIKRKSWGGYWKYRYGKIEMHGKDGSVTDFLNTKDIIFTLSNIVRDDWEVATYENCLISVK